MSLGARQRRCFLGLGALALASMLALPAAADDTRHIGLFGYLEFPSHQLTALPLWRDVLARIADERVQIAECDANVGRCASLPMTVWRAKVEELSGLPPYRRLLEANRYVNGLARGEAADAFASVDHWATPLEVLKRGGDAKDLAVMKFTTLRDAGVANDAMRIVVVYDALRHHRHAVLAVSLDEGTFILDTLSNAVQPAQKVRYYVPTYSVNETTRWAHVVRKPHRADG